MAIVQARCIAEAYDNQNSRHYTPGVVMDFDTDNTRLTCLTTIGGKYVFQYPGHEGNSPTSLRRNHVPRVSAPSEISTSHVEVVSVKQEKNPEERQAIADRLARGRAEARAKRSLDTA